jgi:hypothetical protein
MFETFEEGGTHYVRGTVFVIAVLDRDTLKLKGYVEQAFLTEEDAEEWQFHTELSSDLAYIIQEKPIMVPIHRSEE